MSKKNTLGLAEIFFESLDYPQFARPNFFLNKQSSTNWLRGVYLTALNEVYHHCVSVLDMHFDAKKRNNDSLKLEDFKISIKELIGLDNDTLVDRPILDEIFYSLQYVPYLDNKLQKFTPLEIISLVETALIFIKKEFNEQAKKTTNPLTRPRTKTYFTYLIAQDGPFFNFPKFKNAFRELLYIGKNSEKIEKLFISFHKAAVEIVKLWNEEISFIEQNSRSTENQFKSERVRVEFHSDTLKQSLWSDEKMFDNSVPHEFFLNQDFASYAAKIANLINGEIIHGRSTKLKEIKKDFLNDFIDGIIHLGSLNDNEIAIKNILEYKKLEAPFRTYFSTWFTGRNYKTNSESLIGNNHVDLKVEHNSIGKKIVEFKGLWNPKRKQLIFQLFNYLTTFDGDGYIFLINHTEKTITNLYQDMICKADSGYIVKSWKKVRYKRTAFYYYKSQHKLDTRQVVVYHLIFDIHRSRKVH